MFSVQYSFLLCSNHRQGTQAAVGGILTLPPWPGCRIAVHTVSFYHSRGWLLEENNLIPTKPLIRLFKLDFTIYIFILTKAVSAVWAYSKQTIIVFAC